MNIITNLFDMPWHIQELIWQRLPYFKDEPKWIRDSLSNKAKSLRDHHTSNPTNCKCHMLVTNDTHTYLFAPMDLIHGPIFTDKTITMPCKNLCHECICNKYGLYMDRCYYNCRALFHKCNCKFVSMLNGGRCKKDLICRAADCPNKDTLDNIRNKIKLEKHREEKDKSHSTRIKLYNYVNRQHTKQMYKGNWNSKKQPNRAINYPRKAAKPYR